MEDDIKWIRDSLKRIEGKLDAINTTLKDHEQRISRLEGANKFWIPVTTGLIGTVIGVFVGVFAGVL